MFYRHCNWQKEKDFESLSHNVVAVIVGRDNVETDFLVKDHLET